MTTLSFFRHQRGFCPCGEFRVSTKRYARPSRVISKSTLVMWSGSAKNDGAFHSPTTGTTWIWKSRAMAARTARDTPNSPQGQNHAGGGKTQLVMAAAAWSAAMWRCW